MISGLDSDQKYQYVVQEQQNVTSFKEDMPKCTPDSRLAREKIYLKIITKQNMRPSAQYSVCYNAVLTLTLNEFSEYKLVYRRLFMKMFNFFEKIKSYVKRLAHEGKLSVFLFIILVSLVSQHGKVFSQAVYFYYKKSKINTRKE